MAMTKKNFVALADLVRTLALTRKQVERVADFCAAQNTRFNRRRWMEYVYQSDEEEQRSLQGQGGPHHGRD